MENEYREFLVKLFGKLATGDFTVDVECQDDKIFKADVIGYSDEYMTVTVRFHSDTLSKLGVGRKYSTGFGYGTSDDDTPYELVNVLVPVKVENIYYTSIKL